MPWTITTRTSRSRTVVLLKRAICVVSTFRTVFSIIFYRVGLVLEPTARIRPIWLQCVSTIWNTTALTRSHLCLQLISDPSDVDSDVVFNSWGEATQRARGQTFPPVDWMIHVLRGQWLVTSNWPGVDEVAGGLLVHVLWPADFKLCAWVVVYEDLVARNFNWMETNYDTIFFLDTWVCDNFTCVS